MSDLVSVIVPIYNVGTYIFQCINSLVKQTYTNLEIILVIDGSRDQSLEICESFRKNDSRVSIISKPNGGLVSARKTGLEASKGQYVFYLDGDDWLDIECIEQYYIHAIRYHTDIVLGNYKREFLGSSVIIKNETPSGFYDRERMALEIYPKMIYTGNFFQHGIRTYSWGKLYKRDVIEKLQLDIPNEIVVGEDAALTYPALYASNRIYMMNYAGCNYRQRSNSILKTVSFDYSGEVYKLSLILSYLSKKLDMNDTKSNFIYQLRAYFISMVIIRTGAFFGNQSLFEQFSPFGHIELGSKICLYNSGSFGQHVLKNLKSNDNFKFIGWFDEDYSESNILGMPVIDPNFILDYEFDYLLIASVDSNVTQFVKAYFEKLGVNSVKIRMISVNNKLENYITDLGFDANTFNAI